MAAYYNEVDPFCVEWLKNLIWAGHIADGEVDGRSIVDVSPDDVRGFTQCHWFAGLGAWSHALRLAGWADDRSVWTGSCPCQPFSAAGKRGGFDDDRHLWPVWSRLIAKCRPSVCFGEQVAGGGGRAWFDAVCDDLEDHGYACGAVDFPACGVGSPHIRQRLWWVADADDAKRRPAQSPRDQRNGPAAGRDESHSDAWQCLHGPDWRAAAAGFLAHADGAAARVGRLRAYGNAIAAPVATEVIAAYMEARP